MKFILWNKPVHIHTYTHTQLKQMYGLINSSTWQPLSMNTSVPSVGGSASTSAWIIFFLYSSGFRSLCPVSPPSPAGPFLLPDLTSSLQSSRSFRFRVSHLDSTYPVDPCPVPLSLWLRRPILRPLLWKQQPEEHLGLCAADVTPCATCHGSQRRAVGHWGRCGRRILSRLCAAAAAGLIFTV